MSNRGGLIKFVCHNYTLEYYVAVSTILHKNVLNKETYSLHIAQQIGMLKDWVNDLKQ